MCNPCTVNDRIFVLLECVLLLVLLFLHFFQYISFFGWITVEITVVFLPLPSSRIALRDEKGLLWASFLFFFFNSGSRMRTISRPSYGITGTFQKLPTK